MKENNYVSKYGFEYKLVLTTDYFELPTWEEIEPVIKEHCYPKEYRVDGPSLLADYSAISAIAGKRKRIKVFSFEGIKFINDDDRKKADIIYCECLAIMSKEGAMFPNYAPVIAKQLLSQKLVKINQKIRIYGVDHKTFLSKMFTKSHGTWYSMGMLIQTICVSDAVTEVSFTNTDLSDIFLVDYKAKKTLKHFMFICD